MKCAQGTKLSVKMKDLTFEPIKKSQLHKGAPLMADYQGKMYPVMFEAFTGKYQISVNQATGVHNVQRWGPEDPPPPPPPKKTQ